MKISKRVNIVDVISYSIIIIMLILFIIQIKERNNLSRINIELRIRDCNLPGESISEVLKEIMQNNYSTINNVTGYENPKEELIK